MAPIVVVDASVIVAAALANGRTRRALFADHAPDFVAPSYVLDEIERRIEAARDVEFALRLRKTMRIVPSSEFAARRDEARRLASEARAWRDDEYVALALALDAPIWTFDRDFLRIPQVRAITTAEVERMTMGMR
ncbi:MAG: PIN domain-containing protein [Thermoplasmatota archaeon]